MNTTSYSLSYTFGHGDVANLIDKNGNIVDAYSYDPFGKTTGVSKSSNGSRYVGLGNVFSDDDAGLLYMHNRWYDPELGRFLSRDPIGFRGGLNLYAYVGNNPINKTDKSGLNPAYLLYLYLEPYVPAAIAATETYLGAPDLNAPNFYTTGTEVSIDIVGSIIAYGAGGPIDSSTAQVNTSMVNVPAPDAPGNPDPYAGEGPQNPDPSGTSCPSGK